jgi:anti-anti-sigma factor
MSDPRAPPGLKIVARRPSPKVVVLRVTGEIDLWTSVSLMESIVAAHAEHPELIAVDLSDAKAVDAVGLRVLEEAARLLEDGGVHFTVISPSDHRLA